MNYRILKSLVSSLCFIFLTICLIFNLESFRHEGQEKVEYQSLSMSERIERLERKCKQFSNPFRTEYSALVANEPTKLGVEVVYLKAGGHNTKKPLISVCIPHKVGSHAWGQFSNQDDVKVDQSELDLPWKIKAELSLKVVVVRHPLERLLSVYRMIFENWCDEKRFLAQQWNNVCVTEVEGDGKGFIQDAANATKFSAIQFLYSMADEQRHGNDRYIQKIWQKFNPGIKLVDPKSQLKFTFSQFVRFIINGTLEFEPEVLNHKGLSYHWAPYWQECSLCSSLTQPDIIIHMESFSEDLKTLFMKAGHLNESIVDNLVQKFPHTHSQMGGHSHKLTSKYYSQLTKAQIQSLYKFYRLDHELFGYDPEEYLSYALDSS